MRPLSIGFYNELVKLSTRPLCCTFATSWIETRDSNGFRLDSAVETKMSDYSGGPMGYVAVFKCFDNRTAMPMTDEYFCPVWSTCPKSFLVRRSDGGLPCLRMRQHCGAVG